METQLVFIKFSILVKTRLCFVVGVCVCVFTCAQRLWPSHHTRTSSLWGRQRGWWLKTSRDREVNHSRTNSRLDSFCPHVIRSCLTYAGTESKILLMKGYQRQEKPSYISRVNLTCRQKQSQPSCCLHNLSTGCKNDLTHSVCGNWTREPQHVLKCMYFCTCVHSLLKESNTVWSVNGNCDHCKGDTGTVGSPKIPNFGL